MMSYSHSGSDFNQGELIHEPSALGKNDQPSKPRPAADRAIDAALRSVPLPNGLLSRLGKLFYAMPDETADQVDCLGC